MSEIVTNPAEAGRCLTTISIESKAAPALARRYADPLPAATANPLVVILTTIASAEFQESPGQRARHALANQPVQGGQIDDQIVQQLVQFDKVERPRLPCPAQLPLDAKHNTPTVQREAVSNEGGVGKSLLERGSQATRLVDVQDGIREHLRDRRR